MKKRLFYLDFIRAISTIAIVITHYNAMFMYHAPAYIEKVFITGTIANIYIGNWGVSLFFIISGAALMYTYGDQKHLDLKTFYKKRFLSVYPMFWIAYILGFLMIFWLNRGSLPQIPIWKMGYTIIGFDGYLAENMANFYLLGEWFLGAIILVYLLFPILRKLVNEHPKILALAVLVIYIWIIKFYNIDFNKSKFIFTRLPELLVGMYFVKYFRRISLPVFLASTVILGLNTFFHPNLDASFQTTYIGIASFFVLVYLEKYIRLKGFRDLCGLVCKYSFAIFLVHHIIIYNFVPYFNIDTLSRRGSYILFILCFLIIMVAAKLLYDLHASIMKRLNQHFFELE